MYCIKNECEGFIRIPNARELMKARGPQAECFYCFRVFGNPDETQSTSIWNSFSIAPRNRIKWKYSRIFHMLSVSLLLRNIISNYYHYYHHHYYNYHYYYLIIIILRSVRESGGNVYNWFLSFSISHFAGHKRTNCDFGHLGDTGQFKLIKFCRYSILAKIEKTYVLRV